MKRYIHVLCAVLTSVVLYTSCMKDSDNSATLYNDMAITAFKLTTVNRYLHTTTKAGNDSVYKKVLANPTTFTIDQTTYEIYNTDSLPYGCDPKHVLATISSKNSGQIMLKSFVGDTLYYYSSSDSIDFSQPRKLVVFSTDGSDHREYTVKVNVHQFDNSTMFWEKKTLKDLEEEELMNFLGERQEEWKKKVATAGLREFIGEGTIEAYAFSEDGQIMVSYDDGATWEPDSVSGDASLLPTSNIAFVSLNFAVNDSTDYQLMVGNNFQDDEHNVVWRKIAEFGYDSDPCKWVQLPLSIHNSYGLPKLEHIDLLYYNGLILAVGNDKNIYQSRDKGVTWKTSKAYTLPEGLASNDFSAYTDYNGYIWIYGHDTEEVWRGIKVD